MKTFTSKLFLIICFLQGITTVYAQGLEWVSTYQNNNPRIHINDITTDSFGNVYTVGFFQDSMDFDPSSGSHILTTSTNTSLGFIQKNDPNGNLIWVKSFQSTYSSIIHRGIQIAPNGDVVTMGYFIGRVDFDPGADSFYLETTIPTENLFVLRLDSNGNFIWARQFNATSNIINGGSKFLAIDKHNNTYISSVFRDSSDLDPSSNSYILTSDSTSANFIVKLDANGNFAWGTKCGETGGLYPCHLAYNQDEAIYITGIYPNTIDFDFGPGTHTLPNLNHTDLFYMKVDTSGQLIWVKTIETTMATNTSYALGSITIDNHGDVLLAGHLFSEFNFGSNANPLIVNTPSTYSFFILKSTPNGQLIWHKNIPFNQLSVIDMFTLTTDSQRNLYAKGTLRGSINLAPGTPNLPLTNTNGQYTSFLSKFTADGDFVWGSLLGDGAMGITHIHGLSCFGQHLYTAGIIQGNVDFDFSSNQHLIQTPPHPNVSGFIAKFRNYNNYIQGNLYHDLDMDCQKDSLETSLRNIVIEAAGNQTYWGMTDSAGNYSIIVDTGNYSVYPQPNNLYWQSCQSSFSAMVNDSILIDTVDIGLQETINCPFMQVDITAPLLRQTANGSPYTVSYCNTGTDTAWGAFVRVDLDPYLNFLSSTIPLASQNGNSYYFNLGDVPLNTCGNFQIQVIVDSTALPSQTHCTEAHIYPDTICNVTWNDYVLDVNATCPNNDTVYFQIQNIGAAPMGAKQYYVFEDDVIFYIGNTGSITIGNSHTVAIAANPGKTYRLEIAQAPTYPALLGDSIASAAIEGCHPYPDGSFETGYITQFYNGYRAPFMAIDCQQNVAAYDPNDKSAQPAGYAAAHFIEQHTTLDYKIRFQNTGNDTAFQVILVDTLSAFLDPSSIEITAGSHPFTWNLSGQGVLTFTFDNILLPDSSTNEPASHGFVKFKIHQQPNNPIGTVINNFADIYFDFNPPIRTNTTLHTIGENFVPIIVSVDQIFDKAIDVLVYPNPFSESTTIEVQGKEYESLELTVYDITGRSIQQLNTTSQQEIQLNRGSLTPGIYVYQLKGNQKIINTGKLIVR